MRFHFMSLAVVSLISLSGCLLPETVAPIADTNSPPGNPILKIVSDVDCSLFLGNSTGLIELEVQNVGTVNYTGNADVYVIIEGNKNTSEILETIFADGPPVTIGVDRPNIPAGDWTGGVGIANQGPMSVSCIG